METFRYNGLDITVNKEGASRYQKVSYPIRYGRFSEIRSSQAVFQFNLKGEIKHVQPRKQSWQNPGEWLKRNVADDWIYYSAAGYAGTVDLIGEYYLPCVRDPLNTVSTTHVFDRGAAAQALHWLPELREQLKGTVSSRLIPTDIQTFVRRVAVNDSDALKRKGLGFHSLIGDRITVLPPDARHVDYDVIPVVVADGCLYNCGFCAVKTGRGFSPRSRENILQQILDLRAFYGDDLENYNSVFLGMHDGLAAGRERIEFSAEHAYKIFEIESAYMKDPRLFLFGSVGSLLGAKEEIFHVLNQLPFHTYINVGMESADAETLALLKKPVSAAQVQRAFEKMLSVNARYEKVEVSANFVMGHRLPSGHFPSISNLATQKPNRFYSKGSIYLSPLNNERPTRSLRNRLAALKTTLPLPTYVYLIQGL